MRIGKVWDSEYPWDVRVEKVCGALRDSGHDVILACRNRRDEPLRERLTDGTEVRRMPHWGGVLSRFEGPATFPAFFNPRWISLLVREFRHADVELILCRDLPLAPTAIYAGRSLRVPVVVDVAEHYPGLLKDLYNRHDFRVINLLARNPVLAAAVERLFLPAADGLLVMVEESATRLSELGIPADRIALVSNTPTIERINAMRPSSSDDRPHTASGDLSLVYLGKVERSRGLSCALEGIKIARDQGLAVRLDVFGDGTGLARLESQTATLGLREHVTFHGWQPYETVLAQLHTYDVGIVPHHATDHWNYTIQNKFFDYMAAGIPLLVSSMRPAMRIVRDEGIGLVFQDRDSSSFADALRQLTDPAARERFGRAARRSVVERYNWTEDSARLVRFIEAIGGDRGGARQRLVSRRAGVS